MNKLTGKRLFIVSLAGLSLLLPSYLFAYRNASLDEEAQTYRMVQQLIGFGLVDKVLIGNRPWSRREIARLIGEAKQNLPQLQDVETEIRAKLTLKHLSHLYDVELNKNSPIGFHPFSQLSFEYLFLESPNRAIPRNIGTGDAIDAFVNPLIAYRRGRLYRDHHNLGFEARHFLDLTQYVSIVGRSHFLFRKETTQNDYMQWGFDELYLRSEFKNVGVQFGRDQLAWGLAPEGGVFYSTNATPLDMVKFANVSPFYYPWIFKYLGPAQASFGFAVLGSNRTLEHPYLASWKLSFLPHRNFEFGLTHAVMSGGSGGASTSFDKRVADTFGVFASLGGNDPNISNRVGGFDFSWRFPRLRGLTFYYESLMEDTQSPSHWDLMFWDEAIHQIGLFLPRLNNPGTQTLRFEFQHAGFRPYRHHQYVSGWTHNQRILGSELGPDAYSLLLEFGVEPTQWFHQRSSFGFESRDSDQYTLTNQATSLRKTVENPAERRWRLMHTLEWFLHGGSKWSFQFGYERVEQFNFQVGTDANNFLVDVGYTFYPKI